MLEHELTHAKTLKEASAESARFYKEQLDETTCRLQSAESHITRLEQSLEALQRDAEAEDSLLQSLQVVCPCQLIAISQATPINSAPGLCQANACASISECK